MLATIDQAIDEWVFNVGIDRKDTAWLLSDYDSWHKNPHYAGIPVPHPECEDFDQPLDIDDTVDDDFEDDEIIF